MSTSDKRVIEFAVFKKYCDRKFKPAPRSALDNAGAFREFGCRRAWQILARTKGKFNSREVECELLNCPVFKGLPLPGLSKKDMKFIDYHDHKKTAGNATGS